jgi:hypothetical protein
MMIRSLVLVLFAGIISCVNGRPNDTRTWEQLRQEPVLVRCHSQDIKNGVMVMKIIHAEYPRIAGDLRLPAVQPFTAVITSTDEEFHSLTGGEIPDWGIGAADPVQRIFFLKSPRSSDTESDLRRIVIHELSHVLLGMVFNGELTDRWFDEGFALYESGELGLERTENLARSLFSGEFLNLDQIEDVFMFRKEKAALAYQESRSAVDYLMASYGKDAFTDIAWLLRDGKTMEDAFFNALGISLEEFQNEWIQTLRKRYVLYPFLQFRYILSAAFLILFLTAYFATRYRTRKKREMWRIEEDLYEIKNMEKDTTPN